MPVFSEMIDDAIAQNRSRIALIDTTNGISFTFDELDAEFDRVAALAKGHGLRAGDHAAIYQRNSAQWLIAEGGLAKLGAVIVPVNIYLSPNEAAWVLNHSESVAAFVDGETADAFAASRHLAPKCLHLIRTDSTQNADDASQAGPDAGESDFRVSPNSTYKIMYSSATTGMPKGILCPNRHMAGMVTTALANQLRDVENHNRLLVATPLTHVANSFAWAFFARGASTVVMRRYNPEEFCRLLTEQAVTHTFLAPTLLIDLVNYLDQHPQVADEVRQSGLRALWYAGSPMPQAVARRAEEILGPILNQQYGLTELYGGFPAMACTELRSEWHQQKPGSCGRPVSGCIIRIQDEYGRLTTSRTPGEVLVRLQGEPAGYWSPAEDLVSSYRDGWLHTADVGHFDEDGFLFIVDRKNDMIISGALNIYPTEVENCLAEHPGVLQCAVVGMSDPKWVEVPVAAVVRRPESTFSAEDLIKFARDRIAHYKAPKKVVFVDSLPLTSVGKVSRKAIRVQLQAGEIV